ncbi:MAG: PEP/pyruvate-binding domain-containing protein [Elusimicrobia bacterium]|nr:PEP/pyruvate-binding domain-containing protein [Elusimicrobiota bacterium]
MIKAAVLLSFVAAAWSGETSLRARVLNAGEGRQVTGRVTFGPGLAAGAGCVYAPARFGPGQAAEARGAEALLLPGGGRFSAAAVFARSRRMPALSLDAARWENGLLAVEAPVLGPVRRESGLDYQVVERTVPVRLREGDVVTLDPIEGRVTLHPPETGEAVLAAARALAAYDGLRDGQALLRWWQGQDGGPDAGELLLEGLARRLAAGSARADDYRALRAAVLAALDAPRRGLILRSEIAVFGAESRRCAEELCEELDAVESAASPQALARALARARTRRDGLAALARAAGHAPAASVESLWRRVEAAAADRRPKLSEETDVMAAAAKAAPAELPPRFVIGDDAYMRFVRDNSLGPRLDEILADASLGLRRRCERLRSLLSGPRLQGSEQGRELLGRLPRAAAYAVTGAFASFPDVPAAEVLDRVQEAWAAAFDPGPLGARKRAGTTDWDAAVAVAAIVPAEVSGAVFSRDLAGGSRRRMVVRAFPVKGVSADEYLLDRRTGRQLAPAALGGESRLVPGKTLAALARAAVLLDDHVGLAVRLDFSVADGKLFLLGMRPAP